MLERDNQSETAAAAQKAFGRIGSDTEDVA